MKKYTLISTLLFLFVSNYNYAQWVWDGSTNSNWNTASNWNQNSVPLPGSTVWIPNTSNDPIISSNVLLRAIIVEENAELEIEFGKTLILTTFSALGAVENYGTINNSGTIAISGQGSGGVENGIYNEGIIINIASGAGVGANINIDGIDGRGINLDLGGEFYNIGGTINIGTNQAIDGVGIRVNDGEFYNTTSSDPVSPAIAKINISNTGGNGIGSSDIFTNNGGEINIGSNGTITKVGIKINDGTFTNQWNNSEPTNPVAGIINIDDTTLDGMQSLLGTVENYGTINIGKTTAILGEGILNGDVFNNHSTGKIYIDRTSEDGIDHYNEDQSQVTFSNDGEIHIGSIAAVGGDGILNSSIFNNKAGAKIYVDNTSGRGIATTRSFSNRSDITIGSLGNIGNDGIDVFNISSTGTFTNYGTGNIQINRTQGDGLSARGVSFTNSGTISIGENQFINGNGLVTQSETFTNNSSGEIFIHRAGGTGLNNQRNDFINKGLIEIGETSSVGDYAIRNGTGGSFPATFVNGPCAAIIHIHSNDIVYDNQNTFTNDGLLIEKATETSNIETNNGIVANIYLTGTFNIANDNGKVIDDLGSKLWTGCISTDWFNANNWYPKEVPVENDVIYLEQIFKQAIIDPGKTAVGRTLNIGDGATLTNSGTYDGIASINIWAGGTLKGVGEYFTGGNFVNRGTFNAYTSKVTFDGEFAGGISGTVETVFNDVVVNKIDNTKWVLTQKNWSATGDITVSSGELVVLENYTINGPSILIEAGELDNRGTTVTNNLTVGDAIGGTCTNEGALQVNQDFLINNGAIAQGNGSYKFLQDVINHGTFLPGTSTVELLGVDESQLLGTSDIDFWTLIIYKLINGVTLGTDVSVNNLGFTNGDLLIPFGYQLTAKECPLNNGEIENEGTLKIIEGGFISISGGTAKGNGTYRIEGNWVHFSTGSFQRGTSNVIFTSSDSSYISGTTTSTFYDLKINKGSGLLEAYQDFNVENEMVITSGELKIISGTSVSGNHLSIVNGKLTNNQKITLSSYLHNQSGGEMNGDGQYLLSGDWNNQGIFNKGTSTVTLKGSTTNAIDGTNPQTFYNLKINKSTNTDKSIANTNIVIENEMTMTNGDFDLDANNLTLNGSISGESETNRIFGSQGGEIVKTVTLNNPSDENPGNIGIAFTSTSNLGTTTIRRGSTPKATPTGDGFERYYNIEPTNDVALGATLIFDYFDIENTELMEANLNPWQYTSSIGWMHYFEDNHDVTNNILTKGSLDEIGGIWTIAGDESVDNDGDGTSLADGDCDDTNDLNPTDLILNDHPILEDFYIAPNTITSAGTIENGDVTIFEASTSITMKPGFSAQAGSDFTARIGDCEGIMPRLSNPNTDEVIAINEALTPQQSAQDVSKMKAIQSLAIATQVTLKVYPNPFTIETTIAFELKETSKVQLAITSVQGQILRIPINGEVLAAGQHQQSFLVNDFSPGVYTVVLQTKKETITQRMVIVSN